MKTPLSISISLLVALAPGAAALPQFDDAQALVTTGAPVPGGGLAVEVRDFALSDQGDWCAYVRTDAGGFGNSGVVLLNGAMVVREGDTLPTGEVVGPIFGVDFAPDGTLAWVYRSGVGTPQVRENLVVDGVTRLTTGAAISGVGIPPGSVLRSMSAVRYDGPFALVESRIRVNSGPDLNALLLVDLSPVGAPTLRIVVLEGSQPPLLPGPVLGFGPYFDVAGDGTFIARANFDDGGTTRSLILTDQGPRAIGGTAAPLPGSTWQHAPIVGTACAAGGRYVYSTEVENAQGTRLGVVVGPNGLLALEGAPHPARPGETVDFFAGGWVGISSSGEPAFIAPIAPFRSLLVHRGEVVLEQGVSTVSGVLTATTLTSGFAGRIAVGPGGRQLLTVATLANGESALALVEPVVGVGDPSCTTVPNSTGATGTLRGIGSTVASANQLVLISEDLPPFQFGLLLNSQLAGYVANPGGSAGNLCLGGMIGRFNAQIAAADTSGTIATTVDLTLIPRPMTIAVVQPGETWLFQRWHRDIVGGAQSSNYTDSLAITFL